MYAFINDLSLQRPVDSDDKAISLINELIDVCNSLKTYKIEKLRVPEYFKSRFIFFGRKSLKELVDGLQDEKHSTQRNYILTLFNIITEVRPTEHKKLIDEIETEKICEVSYLETPSLMLTQAHILQLPIISVRSASEFECDFIKCTKLTVEADRTRPGKIQLENHYSSENVKTHHRYLTSLQHGIEFANKRWNPYKNPSWRTEVTKEILSQVGYPATREQAGSGEARKINMKASHAVLEANGWSFNHTVTGYNHGRTGIWRIYTNNLTNEDIYISVDLVEGEFEMCNRYGKWQKTSFFDGEPTNKDYGKSTSHDIRVKNSE